MNIEEKILDAAKHGVFKLKFNEGCTLDRSSITSSFNKFNKGEVTTWQTICSVLINYGFIKYDSVTDGYRPIKA